MKNDEDKRLFQQAMAGVTPLKARDQKHLAPPSPRPRLPIRRVEYPEVPYVIEEKVSGDALLSFARPGISAQTLRHLKRGDWPYEKRLDLHGKTQGAAEKLLVACIGDALAQGLRVVLVIHGKAMGEDYPILKNLCYALLTQHPDVLALCSAPQKHGGAGAIYVLIKQA